MCFTIIGSIAAPVGLGYLIPKSTIGSALFTGFIAAMFIIGLWEVHCFRLIVHAGHLPISPSPYLLISSSPSDAAPSASTSPPSSPLSSSIHLLPPARSHLQTTGNAAFSSASPAGSDSTFSTILASESTPPISHVSSTRSSPAKTSTAASRSPRLEVAFEVGSPSFTLPGAPAAPPLAMADLPAPACRGPTPDQLPRRRTARYP